MDYTILIKKKIKVYFIKTVKYLFKTTTKNFNKNKNKNIIIDFELYIIGYFL